MSLLASFLLTYVGVSHQQWCLGVAGLQLDQLLQTGRGHPAHPLPTKCQGLWVPCFCHQLWTEWRHNGAKDSEFLNMNISQNYRLTCYCMQHIREHVTHHQFRREDQLLCRVQGKKLLLAEQLWRFLQGTVSSIREEQQTVRKDSRKDQTGSQTNKKEPEVRGTHRLRFFRVFPSIQATVCSSVGLAAVGFLM